MRKDRTKYYLSLAIEACSRATCPRRKVGCVITYKNRVVGIGYNGTPSGIKHCIDDECLMDQGSCIQTIHAEINAIATAGINPLYLESGFLDCYITDQPCYSCYKTLVAFGVSKIYYINSYPDSRRDKVAKVYGVEMIQVNVDE